MDIYRYKNSSITNDHYRLTVKISANSKHDNIYLESIITQVNDREELKERIEYLLKSSEFNKIHNHQVEIGEITTELTTANNNLNSMYRELGRMKESWVYKVWRFISDNFSLTKPRGCK